MSLSPTEMEQELTTKLTLALEDAYNTDPAMAKQLEDTIKQSGLGVHDPESPEGMQAMKDVVTAIQEKGGATVNDGISVIAAILSPRLDKADPVPGREMMASEEDQVELEKQLPKAPAVGGPLGV